LLEKGCIHHNFVAGRGKTALCQFSGKIIHMDLEIPIIFRSEKSSKNGEEL
jgi:hypothetical protein